jgi:hypothetical protein
MCGTYFVVKQNTPAGKIVMDPSRTLLKVNPTMLSKLNTGLQFITLLIGIGTEHLTDIIPNFPVALNILCWATGCTTLGSGISYLQHDAFSRNADNTIVWSEKPDGYVSDTAINNSADTNASRIVEKQAERDADKRNLAWKNQKMSDSFKT